MKWLNLHGGLLLPINYRDKFQDLRKRMESIASDQDNVIKTFSGQLFGVSGWFLGMSPEATGETSIPQEIAPKAEKKPTEKSQAIESLRQFAEEKTETTAQKIIKFSGGELEVTGPSKPGTAIHSFDEVAPELKAGDPLEVLFLGDPQREGEEDLLGKMIGAMKLSEGSFVRTPLPEFEDDLSREHFLKEFCHQVYQFKPRVVISLGAAATNLMLKKRERLSLVHGRFLEGQISFKDTQFDFLMVPIFHPDFLVINPKMKRTAWNDLQQVLEFLGEK